MLKWLIGESKEERKTIQQLSDERAEREHQQVKEANIEYINSLITLTCYGDFGFSYRNDKFEKRSRWASMWSSDSSIIEVDTRVLYVDYSIRYTINDDLREYHVNGKTEVFESPEEFHIYEFMCEEIENGAERIMKQLKREVINKFKNASKNERLTEMKEIVQKNQKIKLDFSVKVEE